MSNEVVGRLVKGGPVGAMAQFHDYQEGEPHMEIDEPVYVGDRHPDHADSSESAWWNPEIE